MWATLHGQLAVTVFIKRYLHGLLPVQPLPIGVYGSLPTGPVSPQASGFIITGNYIGGMAPNAGGAAYTVANNTTTVFLGMDLSPGLGTPTSIQGNTIQN